MKEEQDQKQEFSHGGKFNIATGKWLIFLDKLIFMTNDETVKKYLSGMKDGILISSDIFFQTRE